MLCTVSRASESDDNIKPCKDAFSIKLDGEWHISIKSAAHLYEFLQKEGPCVLKVSQNIIHIKICGNDSRAMMPE